jgi:tryptophanyl-tRNA synthetase
MQPEKPVVLSGIRPTGNVHLGNYLGALKNWVLEQEHSRCFYSIVDLHALAEDFSPEEFSGRVLETAATLLAIGIDPQKTCLFLQSKVPAHAEMTWLLSSVATYGELSRMVQFKEKSAKSSQQDSVKVALFTYPVLMAADILLYKADCVPVGEDQKQHLELARNLAERFNNKYAPIFKVPEPLIPKLAARVMDLSDPQSKMSKSNTRHSGIIYLSDSPDKIAAKIKRAVTDTENVISYDPKKRPGVSNLIGILRALNPEVDITEITSYKQLKELVVDAVLNELRPINQRIAQHLGDRHQLIKLLDEASERAREVADDTLKAAKKAMGLIS